MMYADKAAAVFGQLHRLLDQLAPAPAYRALFDAALGSVRSAAESSAVFLPVDLPLAAAEVLGVSSREADIAAAACTSLWAGADLMDDAADGQLAEEWAGVSSHQLALVSTNLLSTLPHMLAAEVDGGETPAAAAFSQAVSHTLFAMSRGQMADFDSAAALATEADYVAMIRLKSAAEFALFASSPAILSAAPAEAVAAWARFGMAYGLMVQAFSDCVGTIVDGPRNDLLCGKRSLPVLLALQSARDDDHTNLVADLDKAASGDQGAVARAIDCMTRHGAIQASFQRIELMRFRATEALPAKLSDLRADHPLRRLLNDCRVI